MMARCVVQVLEGLFGLAEELFGVQIAQVPEG